MGAGRDQEPLPAGARMGRTSPGARDAGDPPGIQAVAKVTYTYAGCVIERNPEIRPGFAGCPGYRRRRPGLRVPRIRNRYSGFR
jgi:hypothetical protein